MLGGEGEKGKGSVPLPPIHDIQLFSPVHISNDDLHLGLRIIVFPFSFSKLVGFVQKLIV